MQLKLHRNVLDSCIVLGSCPKLVKYIPILISFGHADCTDLDLSLYPPNVSARLFLIVYHSVVGVSFLLMFCLVDLFSSKLISLVRYRDVG